MMFRAQHPGVYLAQKLESLDVTQYGLAKATKVPAGRISEIIRGRRVITVDTAIRLEKALGTSALYWLRLQATHDIEQIRPSIKTDDITDLTGQ